MCECMLSITGDVLIDFDCGMTYGTLGPRTWCLDCVIVKMK